MKNLIFKAACLIAIMLTFAQVGASQSATVTLNESTILQASPHRIGINIGSETYYDSGQILKNLLAEDNAGFEPFQLRQIWAQEVSGTTTTFQTNNQYVQIPANRLVGASYKIVESSTAALGCAGVIAGNTTGDGSTTSPVYTLGTACGAATSPGDQMVVTWVESPTPEATWESSQNGMWGGVSNGGKLTSDTVTPYDGKQSIVLDTSAGGGASAQVNLYFDSNNLNTWVRLNGTYSMSVAAKLISGNASLVYSVGRFAAGGANCSTTVKPTGSWAVYTATCTASEGNSTPIGTAYASFSVSGTGKIEIDDAVFEKTSDHDSRNMTVFRDEVFHTIEAWCAGKTGPTCPVRDWLGQNGETLDNWILPASQAALAGVGPASGYPVEFSPRLQDYLRLVQFVNGVPYLEVPVTFLENEGTNLIEFLESTNISSGYGQKRAKLGQTTPWVGPTGIFPEIYLSFCNECWNSYTSGQNLAYRPNIPRDIYSDYAARAGSVFAAMRSSPSFNPTATHLGFNLQEGLSYNVNVELAAMGAKGGAPDYLEQGPYSQAEVSNWQTDAGLWGSAMEEPFGDATDPASVTGFNQAAKYVQSLNLCGQKGNSPCIATDYEQQNSTWSSCGISGLPACTGSDSPIDQTHLDYINAGGGQGIITPLQALLNMQYLNIPVQNVFALNEYVNGSLFPSNNPRTVKLWGVTVDMGGACSLLYSAQGYYCPRPQMLGTIVANSAIIGPMYSCNVSGTGTTYNWPGDVGNGPTHALNNVPYVYSFCFKDTLGNRAITLVNTNLTAPYTVSFSGTNPPSGAVIATTFDPPSVDSLNEAPTGQLTNTHVPSLLNTSSPLTFKAGTTFSLAPHSITTLTYSAVPEAALALQVYNDLMTGKPEQALYTKDFFRTFTAAYLAGTKAQMGTPGAPTGLSLISQRTTATGPVYWYTATFASGATQEIHMDLDTTGLVKLYSVQ
jgi:hypothetical protein